MALQTPVPAARPPQGSEAALVGPVLLVVDTTDATVRPLAVASLLVADHMAAGERPTTAPGSWATALFGSLSSMGWVSGSITSDSVSFDQPGTFEPWAQIRAHLADLLGPDDLAALEGWSAVLVSAPHVVADRWRTATILSPSQFTSTIAVASSTAAGPQLIVAVAELSYPEPARASTFPWGEWPSSGAKLQQSVAALQISAADGASLLAALTPKVAPVLGTEVISLNS